MKEFKLTSIKKFVSLPKILLLSILLINLFLVNIPLTNVIGYEYSFLNSLMLFLAAGIIVIYYSYNIDIGSFSELINKLKKPFLLLCVLPLLVGFFSTLLFSLCPINKEILYYIVIALPSPLFGASTGIFIISISKKFRYLLFVTLFLLILISSLLEFYFYPQLYFYNPIFGYFAGTIYDEEVSINNILLSYRLMNILFFVYLIFISYLIQRKFIKKIYAIISVIVFVLIFWQIKPVFHFSTTSNSLRNYLTNKIETKYITIYASHKIKKAENLKLLKLLHDYYYEEVKKELELKENSKIISYVFYDENEKGILFGSKKADIAKPWLGHIYLTFSNYQETLKHELVHALASHFGKTIFKITPNFNPAIIEGLSMAIDNKFDNYPVHYAAKIAYDSNYKVNLKKLFTGFNFFTNYSALSYVYAGSFIKFLIENYGIKKVKDFYSNPDFKKVFNSEFYTIEKKYYEFLSSLKIKANNYKAQLYFGGKTLFKKSCPRIAAYETKKALKYYNDQKYFLAEKYFSKIYKYSESYEALSGLINCYLKQNKLLSAEKLLKKEIKKFSKSNYYYTLELMLADIFIQNKKYISAVSLLDSIIIQNPHIEYVNQSLLRKEILNKNPNELVDYYKLSIKGKINYLINLNKNYIYYFSIPLIISLCKDENELSRNVFELFKNKLIVNDFSSSYSAFKLSLAALNIGEYELAKKFAAKSLQYNGDRFFLNTLKENFNKINWIIAHSGMNTSKLNVIF